MLLITAQCQFGSMNDLRVIQSAGVCFQCETLYALWTPARPDQLSRRPQMWYLALCLQHPANKTDVLLDLPHVKGGEENKWAEPTPGLRCSCPPGRGVSALGDITEGPFPEQTVFSDETFVLTGQRHKLQLNCFVSGSQLLQSCSLMVTFLLPPSFFQKTHR